jgi:thiol:disulfide interchange protein
MQEYRVLTESSYHLALYTYVGAASVMLCYLTWWLGRHWRPWIVAFVVLILAALLLTPAFPKAGVDTMAPALIVAAFQVFTQGMQAAQHALRPLVFMSGIAIAVALLLSVTVLRGRKARKSVRGKAQAKA